MENEKEGSAGGIEAEVDVKEEWEVGDYELKIVTEDEEMELVACAEQEVQVKGKGDDDMEDQNLDLTVGHHGIEKQERKANANIELVEHGRMAFKGCSFGRYMKRCSSNEVNVLGSSVWKDMEEVEEDEGIELEEDHQQQGDDLEEEYEQQGEDEDDGEQGQAGLFNLLPNHHVVDNFSEDFVASGHGRSVGRSIFNNGSKRQIEHEAAMSPPSLHVGYKKLKVGRSWEHEYTDFDSYCDQMEQYITAMRMVHKEKEQACAQSTANEQYLLSQVQERDNIIEQLNKAKYDEVRKWKMEIYKRDRELTVMYKLVQDYQMALRETNRSFSEYRKLCPKPDEEPLYMDVVGGGGLVLSKAEVEKLRLRKEAEEAAKRFAIEKQIVEFEEAWCKTLKAHLDTVNIFDSKIAASFGEVGLLNRRFQNRKSSHVSGPPLAED